MTRINVIDPKYLTDQHLMAEYRELPMVMSSLRRSLASKTGLKKIPEQYTLNTGHVSFFYPRGKFLKKRYEAIVQELRARGYELDPTRKADFSVFTDNNLYGDWEPDHQALTTNVARVKERILQKPHWYRYKGRLIVELDNYNELINPCVLWKP
jgi:deoxyribonuclease (pyrimidine dimer)